jgi:hypothetical protein
MTCKNRFASLIRMLIIAATASALVMNVAVCYSCAFLQVQEESNKHGVTAIGVFALQKVNGGGGCARYQNDKNANFVMSSLVRKAESDDSFVQNAQMGVITAMSFGAGTLLLLLVHHFMCRLCCIRWFLRYVGYYECWTRGRMVLVIVFGFRLGILSFTHRHCCPHFYSFGYCGAQLATVSVYLLYLSDYCIDGNCAWAQGADYNVAAQCLYLGAFVLAGCCLGAAESRRKNDDSEEDNEPIPTTPPTTTTSLRSDAKHPRTSNKYHVDQGKKKSQQRSSKKWLFKRTKKNSQKDDDNASAVSERLEAGGGTTASSVTSGSPTEPSTIPSSTGRPPWFANYY